MSSISFLIYIIATAVNYKTDKTDDFHILKLSDKVRDFWYNLGIDVFSGAITISASYLMSYYLKPHLGIDNELIVLLIGLFVFFLVYIIIKTLISYLSTKRAVYKLIFIVLVFGLVLLFASLAHSQSSVNITQFKQRYEVTFLAVGDIMLSRNVAAKIAQAKNPLLPFQKVKDLLLATDFNVGNLESPFSGKDYYPKTGSLVFNVPRANVQGLVKYNFKVLTLANNHALDQGLKGLIYTKNYLRQNNIQAVGVGQNLTEAWQPAVIEAKGVKLGFMAVSYASLNDNGKKANNNVARIEDETNLKTAIARAKESADLVVVNMHAGTEYKHQPNSAQIKFAHAAIDAGADLVIGHHPHWTQIMEKYQGKYIFYSLGNFIFDQMWSTPTRQGLTVKVTITKEAAAVKLSKLELMPVIIDNYSTPRLANPKEAQVILKSIGVAKAVINLSSDN